MIQCCLTKGNVQHGLSQGSSGEMPEKVSVYKTPHKILRANEVENLTGLSKTTIWRQERKGQFPQRRKLIGNLVGWFEHEVVEWLKARPFVQEDHTDQLSAT